MLNGHLLQIISEFGFGIFQSMSLVNNHQLPVNAFEFWAVSDNHFVSGDMCKATLTVHITYTGNYIAHLCAQVRMAAYKVLASRH